jgi:hypothetical protein
MNPREFWIKYISFSLVTNVLLFGYVLVKHMSKLELENASQNDTYMYGIGIISNLGC